MGKQDGDQDISGKNTVADAVAENKHILSFEGWVVLVVPTAAPMAVRVLRTAVPMDLSDEEADSAGPVKWVVPAWEVLAHDRAGWRGGLKSLRVNECE
jgi:hypothetical protein